MDDAQLHFGLRKGGLDGFRKAFQPIHARDENIAHAAIFEVGQHGQPELCSFGFARPETQCFLLACHVHADEV